MQSQRFSHHLLGRPFFARVLPALTAFGLGFPLLSMAADPHAGDRFAPGKMMGVETCGDCHDSAVEAWEQSAHATSFLDLHERPLAKDIASLLGIRPLEIRRHQACVRCHVTEEEIHSVIQVNRAVSCESCHGAAADWIDLHNTASLSHAERTRRSREQGMIHPSSLYDLGKRCFECHVIDVEPLVNVAGHPAVSEGFELLSWSQGEVKHNFLVERPGRSKRKSSSTPQPVSQERKRMLYLTGKLLHLGASLEAVSRADDPPVDLRGEYIRLANGEYTYGVQLAAEIRRLTQEIRDLQAMISNAYFDAVLSIVADVKLVTGNQEELSAAAEEIDQVARDFSQHHSGDEFAVIDPILSLLEMR